MSEMGRICYEAFKDLADRHGFPPDFPSAAAARGLLGVLASRKDFYSVAAFVGDRLVGSNFLSLTDAVAGAGPITVEVPEQSQDVGRALMTDVIDHARRSSISQVRLFQDAFNMVSLSLYTSLGFDVREPCAVMSVFCPLSEGELFRGLVRVGGRVIKVMNLMTMGPYEAPGRVWMPSVLY